MMHRMKNASDTMKDPYIRLQNELSYQREELKCTRDRLFHQRSILSDAQFEISKLERREKELLDGIKKTRKKMSEEEKKLRCPKCRAEFTSSHILQNLKEDEDGMYWECPKECGFKARYDDVESGDLIAYYEKEKTKWLERTFQSIDNFLDL